MNILYFISCFSSEAWINSVAFVVLIEGFIKTRSSDIKSLYTNDNWLAISTILYPFPWRIIARIYFAGGWWWWASSKDYAPSVRSQRAILVDILNYRKRVVIYVPRPGSLFIPISSIISNSNVYHSNDDPQRNILIWIFSNKTFLNIVRFYIFWINKTRFWQ